MRRRFVEQFEQPHMLRRGLQSAVLSMPDAGSSKPITRPAESAPQTVPARRAPVPVGMGVPHGVRTAIVYADNVRVAYYQGQPDIFFCGSNNYRVLADTVCDGDGGTYPPPDRNLISASCPMPVASDGYYSVRMRVSVNGSLAVHIEQIGEKAARESEELVPAGA